MFSHVRSTHLDVLHVFLNRVSAQSQIEILNDGEKTSVARTRNRAQKMTKVKVLEKVDCEVFSRRRTVM